MVGWPHWHVIIWGRLVVNWILEKVFLCYIEFFLSFLKWGKIFPLFGEFLLTITPLDELPERVTPADADSELHDALFSLEEKLRLPIVLHYIEGFSISEIARILRCPKGTVKSRMRRGRQALKIILNGEDQLLCEI